MFDGDIKFDLQEGCRVSAELLQMGARLRKSEILRHLEAA
jgi:hypothetical protein